MQKWEKCECILLEFDGNYGKFEFDANKPV